MPYDINSFVVDGEVEESNNDVIAQNEICILLIGNFELLGFYIALKWLIKTKILRQKTHKQLCDLLGVSPNKFIRLLKQLDDVGIVQIEENSVGIRYVFPAISRIPFVSIPKKLSEQKDYLTELRGSIGVGELNSLDLFAPKILQKKKPVVRFKKEDYKKVLDAYTEYKGVTFKGNEKNIALRDIKEMFKSGRSVDDISKCMAWFKDKSSSDDENYRWTKMWTIGTVKRKLPEFVNGLLDIQKEKDEFRKLN